MTTSSTVPIKVPYVRNPLFISALDVLNDDIVDEEFLVDKILPRACICLLSGSSDTGKSILAQQIALDIALGRKNIIGLKTNLRHKKSLYFSTEDFRPRWAKRLKRIELTDEERKLVENMTLFFEASKFSASTLKYFLVHEPVDIAVIDVLVDIYPGDMNSATGVRNFLNPYKEIARITGTTILFIAHTTKKSQLFGGASKGNVSGSHSIEAAMRGVLELRNEGGDDATRLLHITKSNYLSPADKKQPIKLHLLPSLQFENRGEKVVTDRIAQTDCIRNAVIEEHLQGRSIREIESNLKELDIIVGRTKIGKLVNEYKDSNIAA